MKKKRVFNGAGNLNIFLHHSITRRGTMIFPNFETYKGSYPNERG